MDVIESNEAFAAQAMAVTQDFGLDPAKVNPNGGAVALVTMCIGGGQGIAAIFERLY